jgi:hypothetical protein
VAENASGGSIALAVGVMVLLFHRVLMRVYLFFFGRILTSRPLPMSQQGAERFLKLTLLLVGVLLIVGGIGLLMED